ncbi:MAG: Gfo/Idh/MocA family oxidoreductase [Lentisphaerae bacterium]|jgi:virulence factor|nr:Gfo/Idh/MocA family oxidoreductase [Lentisphaerota bacterium]MBT4820563.1 Gfo/Idh/MocA family oxidoreductase [Lentisphaerota bacterium]MBT5606256.1 Gfo/Idh/MocA family oxidoreductase [Lentisphaerota bacterium]MBT7054083.1 Gfo/Idh/MocA family oxidoreductase [Lentisphaerota bacterium]MBT7845122.1 Gfo/Idh/MocA family oxidoreductase [Lentisphaerota bacterium]
MIKVGIVDFDTSHVAQFTKRMNHVDIDEEQWVDGAKVVAGFPGTSRHSPERVPEYTEELRGLGVEIVDNLTDLIGKVDAVCIESNDGTVHLERAKPFIEAGIPCYIDKPFEVSLDNAKEIMRLAKANNVPTFSSSSLRFCPEVQDILSDETVGKIMGANAYSPGSEHPINPGLFNYGIHGVEILYTLMGGGCQKLSCAYAAEGEVVTGMWDEGRIGVLRATRAGAHSYGYTVWGEKAVKQSGISTKYIYRELCKVIVDMFTTGNTPIDPMVTLEIVAFMDAAIKSNQQGGAWVDIDLSL